MEDGQGGETLEQLTARHGREQRDLETRLASKKRNATKKTRKGVADECAALERQLRERQAEELRQRVAGADGAAGGDEEEEAVANGHGGTEEREGGSADAEAVAAQLAAARIGDDEPKAAAAASPQPQQQQQQPAKKRNRQRERLARRAAEQEEAAEAAAAEASTMEDRRGGERERMQAQFAAHALAEHEIRPDGHCLFAAVADQLETRGLGLDAAEEKQGGELKKETEQQQQQPPYKRVREAAATYMLSHADDFAPFVVADDDGAEAGGLEAYAARMRDTAAWGGQLELQALANAYGIEIRVVQAGSTEIIRPADTGMGHSTDKDKDASTRIWLAYYRHTYGLGEHYNSLRSSSTSLAAT